jgi:hypothetical protein
MSYQQIFLQTLKLDPLENRQITNQDLLNILSDHQIELTKQTQNDYLQLDLESTHSQQNVLNPDLLNLIIFNNELFN